MSIRDAIAAEVTTYLDDRMGGRMTAQECRHFGERIGDIAADIVDRGMGASTEIARVGRPRNLFCEHCHIGHIEFAFYSRMHDRPVFRCQKCGRETYGVSA